MRVLALGGPKHGKCLDVPEDTVRHYGQVNVVRDGMDLVSTSNPALTYVMPTVYTYEVTKFAWGRNTFPVLVGEMTDINEVNDAMYELFASFLESRPNG